MQFLDSIGLAYFWEKIKSWAGKNYVEKDSNGNVHISGNLDVMGEITYTEKSDDDNPRSVNISDIGIQLSIGDTDGTFIGVDQVSSDKIIKKGGTDNQVLMANGEVKELGTSKNNIPHIDANNTMTLEGEDASLELDSGDGLSSNAEFTPKRVTLSQTVRNSKTETSISAESITSPKIVKQNGTSTQVLMADGSVKEVGSASGIAQLDSNGNVPLSQLGNLDTTVAEVVQSLPTSNIKNHIYLVPSSNTETNNVYTEYLYVDGKWEKLGEFKPEVDLSPYAKKKEAISRVEVVVGQAGADFGTQYIRFFNVTNDQIGTISIAAADVSNNGLMSAHDKRKLDGIAENATADSAIPTSAIDALS